MSEEAPKVTLNADECIDLFIKLRDILKELDEEHERRTAPLLEKKKVLEGRLQELLDQTGGDSIKTAHGTCHLTTRRSTSLADPDAFMNFVKDTEQWELLDRRANTTAVYEFVRKNGGLPPGCTLSAVKTIGVRRPTEK